ncbi:MAG TPA: chemotaxis protein CheB [Polyangia bacterium]|nr:chemotaxis protein CheB [Polyangia bacterium]
MQPGIDVVVIGGSSGALEALAVVLPALPADTAVPIVIVVHLPPDRPSHLAAVLGARTALRVREAEDKEPLAPGVIYVGPPNYHLLIERGGTLSLSADDLLHFSRPSIDVLFESAADAYGARLTGVVLSGANADGADGLAAIRRAGGLAVAQAPESALVRTMPEAAIARAHPEYVLDLAQMAELVARIAVSRTPRISDD